MGLFLLACSGPEEKAKKTNKKPLAKKKVDGAKVYKQYCVTCHGIKGDMGASGAFNLVESKLSLEEKINIITNGRNTMTAFEPILTEAKIKAVAEYTETLKK